MARFARVSVVAYPACAGGPDWIERTRESVIAHLREAGRARPDLVVFPEGLNCRGHTRELWWEVAEPIPGPTFAAVAEVAAELGCFVVLPLIEHAGTHLLNTAAFIGRDGGLVGKYHKIMPTMMELEFGVRPGTEAPAFTLDFGRVGAAICFDIHYDHVGRMLADSGCELVCFVAQTRGGDRLLHWVRDYGYYIATSYPEMSYLVDMAGRFLGQTGWEMDQVRAGLVPPICSAVINMDRMLFHLAGNQDKFPEILKKYGPGVEIEIHYPEAHCTIASLMDDVTVEDLVAEFELEPWVDYLNRCRRVREEHLP
ncbi:carbon-nitrogen hydrolase family protein [bacterium]|nr:carbon-nitrogen hydrolase family protein [bacterium]